MLTHLPKCPLASWWQGWVKPGPLALWPLPNQLFDRWGPTFYPPRWKDGPASVRGAEFQEEGRWRPAASGREGWGGTRDGRSDASGLTSRAHAATSPSSFLCLCLMAAQRHMEVLRPEAETASRLQLQQCRILQPTALGCGLNPHLCSNFKPLPSDTQPTLPRRELLHFLIMPQTIFSFAINVFMSKKPEGFKACNQKLRKRNT